MSRFIGSIEKHQHNWHAHSEGGIWHIRFNPDSSWPQAKNFRLCDEETYEYGELIQINTGNETRRLYRVLSSRIIPGSKPREYQMKLEPLRGGAFCCGTFYGRSIKKYEGKKPPYDFTTWVQTSRGMNMPDMSGYVTGMELNGSGDWLVQIAGNSYWFNANNLFIPTSQEKYEVEFKGFPEGTLVQYSNGDPLIVWKVLKCEPYVKGRCAITMLCLDRRLRSVQDFFKCGQLCEFQGPAPKFSLDQCVKTKKHADIRANGPIESMWWNSQKKSWSILVKDKTGNIRHDEKDLFATKPITRKKVNHMCDNCNDDTCNGEGCSANFRDFFEDRSDILKAERINATSSEMNDNIIAGNSVKIALFAIKLGFATEDKSAELHKALDLFDNRLVIERSRIYKIIEETHNQFEDELVGCIDRPTALGLWQALQKKTYEFKVPKVEAKECVVT